MSATFDSVCWAVRANSVHVSEHAYDEAVADHLSVLGVVDATASSEVIEDYPDDARGPSCLVLAWLGPGAPVHAVWGFDEGSGQAILITVYRPDSTKWSADFRVRLPK